MCEVKEIELNGTTMFVIDDFIEFKISRTPDGYKIVILENNCCDIDVEFSDDVEEFET